jgi:predicted Na+-dependent transporter
VLIRPLPLLHFFVAIVMFTIGLRVSTGDLYSILRARGLLMRTLVANCILIPAIGFVLVRIFPLTPDASIGIMLLAAIPGTPISLQFTRMAKTRLAFAATVIFVLSLVSIAMTPLVIETMPETLQHSDRPISSLLATVALYIALPLCVGVWAARRAPNVAPRLVLPLGILASVVFVFLMWDTRLIRREAFNTMRGTGTVLAMVLLLLFSMLIGWLIGGPDRDTRRILATSTGMRNVIVVWYIARYCFPGTQVYMIPLVYLSLMVPANLLFHLLFIRRRKLRPAQGREAA